MKRILITGAAGFIGFHLAKFLKTQGHFCIGFDNFNAYYDPNLKIKRAELLKKEGVDVAKMDLCNKKGIIALLQNQGITHVLHLAAQAGVRHSLLQPDDYVASNLQGFVSLLEAIRLFPSIQLVYASSSSVYGLNQKIPFSIEDQTDQPANLYGATKKANELIAHAYHHLYGISATALRYFTVYGPWGRPDMAYYRFTQKILNQEPIQVFNRGEMKRDFTYIDDIVKGTAAALDLGAGYHIFNLGNRRKVSLLYLIELLEKTLGKRAIKEMLPLQPGEVLETFADIETSQTVLGFHPEVSIEEGIGRFVDWFKEFHAVETLLA